MHISFRRYLRTSFRRPQTFFNHCDGILVSTEDVRGAVFIVEQAVLFTVFVKANRCRVDGTMFFYRNNEAKSPAEDASRPM